MAALLLMRGLLARGRAHELQALVDRATRSAHRAGDEGTLLDLSLLIGHAAVDRLRFDEAESILATALTTVRRRADPARLAEASLGLARCLFWRGRYAEAAACSRPKGGPSSAWSSGCGWPPSGRGWPSARVMRPVR